ncbi:MAG TPA: hypothetical protein VMV79_01270, partial [Alphaproteobacteria bacterium]|nr:hypothetical protein [Alphaproteobacteria bacterium]
ECGTFKQNGASNAALIRAFAARGVEFVNLINFSLQTLSGNKLCRNAHVSGAVLAVPEKDKP